MRLPFELRGGLLLAANTFSILCLAFPVQVLIARYLGPEKMGEFAFIMSFWVIARVFVALNLQDVIIPLSRSEQPDRLYSTGWCLSKAASLLLLLVTGGLYLAFHFMQQQRSSQVALGVLIVVVATLFMDHEIFAIWCKAEGELWDYVKVDLGGTSVGLTVRLAILAVGGPLWALLASYVVEQLAKLVIAIALYRFKNRSFLNLNRASLETAKVIGRQGWPVFLSALLSISYARFDQILLGSILNETKQLGQYAVAIRIVEAMTAGAVALFIVYLPILSKHQGQRFETHLQRLHDLMLWGCLLIFIPLFFTIQPIIVSLFGAPYASAGELAKVYLLGFPALCLSYSRAAFMYSKGLQRLELLLKVAGVVANVALNIALIPRYGALGAVWATVIVQWSVSVVVNVAWTSLHPVGRAIWKSALLPFSFARIWRWAKDEEKNVD